MIIQIAGTSGSGKSFLMEKLLAKCKLAPMYEAGRKTPIAYLASLKGAAQFHVIGSYETDGTTKGCDTIRNVEDIYRLLRALSLGGANVVFEGLFVMNQTRGPQLAADRPVTVLQLTTPLAVCKVGIDARRAVRGEGPLDKMDNTKSNHRRAEKYCASMREAGARVIKVDRDAALELLIKLLKEH